MSLSHLALVGGALVLSMDWTHRRFKEVHGLETAYIAVDNAAIRLGQSSRQTWNHLVRFNTRVRAAEVAHHFWHGCARNPVTALKCGPVDRAWEAAISKAHSIAWQQARLLWKAGTREAERQGREAGLKLQADRPSDPPVRPVLCSHCGLKAHWELRDRRTERVRTWWGERELVDIVEWIGMRLVDPGRWNYRIRPSLRE